MKISTALAALSLSFITVNAFAVQVDINSTSTKSVGIVESQSAIPFEFEVEGTYAGSGDIERGRGPGLLSVRDFDETDFRTHFIFTPRVKIGILRLGVQTERYSFGFSHNAATPDALHSTAFVIGLDTEFSDSFLIRLEAQPGFYGTDFDDFGRDTFNAPFILGGAYIFSSSFQLTFGISGDAFRKYPVLPGGGVRWKFAPHWTLNAVLPTPRLEYEINNDIMVYGGADIRSTSYRVDKQFGTLRGDARLNHGALTYDEVRLGAGFEWKLSSAVKLSVEGGGIPYRTFDFHRAHVRYREDGIVPYGMIALHAAF